MSKHLSNHLSEEQLVALVLGENGGETKGETGNEAAAGHVKSCAACGDVLAEMRQVLAAVEARPVPERNEAYGREVWARIQPQLERQKRTRWFGWLKPQQTLVAAAMALILVFGVLLGRFTAPEGGRSAEQVRERILLVAVGEHLDRSQMVLVELVNAGGNGTVDISAEQEWAEDLVADNRLYRLTAAEAGDIALTELLDELERVLLEIAHSPAEMESAEFNRIRERIEEQGILFKVRVVRSQVREREEAGWQEPTPENSQS